MRLDLLLQILLLLLYRGGVYQQGLGDVVVFCCWHQQELGLFGLVTQEFPYGLEFLGLRLQEVVF